MKTGFCILLALALIGGTLAVAQEATPEPTEPAEVAETAGEDTPAREVQEDATPAAEGAPRFAVFIPERIEQQWYWLLYTTEIQHVVQSAVEKALVQAGFDVLDVMMMNLPPDGAIAQVAATDQAVQRASASGAQYVIVGLATAEPQSESSAYGLRVTRASATVTARLVRVADARVLSVHEASAVSGGEAFRGAAREALKKSGADAGRQLAQAAREALAR